jgi:two-component system chemotaxis response regulator CheY
MQNFLVVDDSSVVRKVAGRILKELKFNIIEAEDGQVALNHCLESMPDFVLLDWNMPVMSGIEFLIALRALGGDNQPKVIFCTTENDMDHIQKALIAGADEYIMKPFDHDILKTKLIQIGALEADDS